NTSFCNIESLRKLEEPELVEINSADANSRGIREGDWVRVFNDRGEVRLRAHVNAAVQAGDVSARLNWPSLSPDFKTINTITSATAPDIGARAYVYCCLVEIEALPAVRKD